MERLRREIKESIRGMLPELSPKLIRIYYLALGLSLILFIIISLIIIGV